MIQIQLFKLLVFCFSWTFIFALDVKPDNNNNLVKIKVDDKNRTYFHLKKNDVLEYTLNDKGIDNFNIKHSLKLISRTLIASNSNSNKVFGIEMSVYNHVLNDEGDVIDFELITTRKLMYDKVVSNAVSDAKPGWNYTKAGFWFEELDDLNKTIKIRLIDGSPAVDLKLIIDEISLRRSESEFEPITVNEEFVIQYKEKSEEEYKKSDNWFVLKEGVPLQYKISGPRIIRFISRINIDESNLVEDDYSFVLREDGRFVANYRYDVSLSEADAYVHDSNISVSGYKSSFYNVPKGIHYYTFFNNEDDGIYLKLEEYENKQ